MQIDTNLRRSTKIYANQRKSLENLGKSREINPKSTQNAHAYVCICCSDQLDARAYLCICCSGRLRLGRAPFDPRRPFDGEPPCPEPPPYLPPRLFLPRACSSFPTGLGQRPSRGDNNKNTTALTGAPCHPHAQ